MTVLPHNNNPPSDSLTDKARQMFIDAGFDYSILTESNLKELGYLLDDELADFPDEEIAMELHYYGDTPYHVCKTKDGEVRCVEFTVDGSYFRKREAITFNEDGFIGFAGWACKDNTVPFTDAFRDWVKWLTKKGKGETE